MKYKLSKRGYRLIIIIMAITTLLSNHHFRQQYQNLSDQNIENIRSKYDAWNYNDVLQDHIKRRDIRIKDLEQQLAEQPQ